MRKECCFNNSHSHVSVPCNKMCNALRNKRLFTFISKTQKYPTSPNLHLASPHQPQQKNIYLQPQHLHKTFCGICVITRCHEHCQAAILSSVETCTIDNMPSTPLLTHYTAAFSKLNPNKNRDKYTTGLAPHKPLLLISLLTLKHSNRIDLSNITVTSAESVPPGCDSANIINWSNFDYHLSLPI